MMIHSVRVCVLKTKTVILLTLLALASACTAFPVTGGKVIEYKANGTIDSYVGVGSAEVVHGSWLVFISGGEVEFRYFYHELNLDPDVENSPEGSVDHFKIYLTGVDYYEVDCETGECVIEGYMTWDKKWWNIDTGKPEWRKPFIVDMPVRIVITAETIEIDTWNNGDVNVVGTTLNIHCGGVSKGQGVVYSANGELVAYSPLSPHAEVVDGHWNVKVKGGGGGYSVEFDAFYRELNLGGEGAPEYDQAEGKIDHFKLFLTDAFVVDIVNDLCIVEGELWVNAKHWNPETLKPWFDPPGDWYWGHVVVVIDSSSIHMDWGGMLCLTGTTTSVQY